MKKLICGILTGTILLMAVSLSGCSAVQFNPTGRWLFDRIDTYESGNFQYTTDKSAIASGMLTKMTLVFEKNGTGYIDAGTGNKANEFRYEYTNNTLTTYVDRENGPTTVIEYEIADDGSAIMRSNYYSEDDFTGASGDYCDKYVYERVTVI